MFYRFRRRLRALFPKLNIELFYAHYLENIPLVECKIPITIEIMGKDRVDKINTIKKQDINKLNMRLERGDLCYVALTKNEGKIASYHWVQKSGKHFIQQAGYHVEINKNEACIYHVRVADVYKGNKINGAVYSKILFDAKSNGLNKVWIYTNFYNHANKKGLEKLGFIIESKLYSLQFNSKFYSIYKKNITNES